MPQRDNRFWISEFLKIRDGYRCSMKDKTCKGSLVIDHVNGNGLDMRPENLRWLCVSHNRREGQRSRKSEREKNYEDGSAEMKVNIGAEPRFRSWIMHQAFTGMGITKDDAINGGAEIHEISPTTARKYLAKITSQEGPLEEKKDKVLGKIIRPRDPKERKG